MEGICRLCSSTSELQESHIIPAFAFRWLKASSATPFMRDSRNPNVRAQDGLRRFWLCRVCEQRFGDWETEFARILFHPITAATRPDRIAYSNWLLQFCSSVSWRLLLLAQEETSFADFGVSQRTGADEALSTHREFLRGLRPHPGRFEHHIIVFDEIESYRGDTQLPKNFNRYLLRSVEMDIAYGNRTGFTFAKMGPFALVGFLYRANNHEWSGAKVHVRHAAMEASTYNLPMFFFDYLVERARKRQRSLRSYLMGSASKLARAPRKASPPIWSGFALLIG